jgi:hypothetical protein
MRCESGQLHRAMKTFALAVVPSALILTSLALLLALAYASPPDPSWISGVYDDADYDDVVTLVMAGTAGVPTAIPTDSSPQPLLISEVPPLVQSPVLPPLRFGRPPRAPPAR